MLCWNTLRVPKGMDLKIASTLKENSKLPHGPVLVKYFAIRDQGVLDAAYNSFNRQESTTLDVPQLSVQWGSCS
ncbi:hypothetical protein MHYP_G00113000 [Metynnis hypsauchen]